MSLVYYFCSFCLRCALLFSTVVSVVSSFLSVRFCPVFCVSVPFCVSVSFFSFFRVSFVQLFLYFGNATRPPVTPYSVGRASSVEGVPFRGIVSKYFRATAQGLHYITYLLLLLIQLALSADIPPALMGHSVHVGRRVTLQRQYLRFA